MSDLDFDTPRQSTARIPILCELCRKQGKVTYRKDDDPRYGGGHYSGPTMKLTAVPGWMPLVPSGHCVTWKKRVCPSP